MKAKREQRHYADGRVWFGRYRNSHNMPHWHYDCELILIEKGSIDLFCEQKLYSLSSGDCVLIMSGQVHNMHAHSSEAELSMLIFDYDIIKPFVSGKVLVTPLLSGNYNLQALFAVIKEEIKSRQPLYTYKIETYLMQTVIDIFRNEQTAKRERFENTTIRFKELLNEIDERCGDFDLNEASLFMNMNAAYFSRLFHKITGMTFSQYLNYVRTASAVKLLQSDEDLSVTDICYRCGFLTIRNFNRIFKEFTGYTPKKLPKSFVMKESILPLNESSTDPTLVESELLESSDGF